jgi:hypothetical protein
MKKYKGRKCEKQITKNGGWKMVKRKNEIK